MIKKRGWLATVLCVFGLAFLFLPGDGVYAMPPVWRFTDYTWATVGGDQFHMGYVIPQHGFESGYEGYARLKPNVAVGLPAPIPRPREKWKAPLWRTNGKKGFTWGTPVIDKQGWIYIINDAGVLWKVSPDGKDRIDYKLNTKFKFDPTCPPAISYKYPNGTLYAVAIDNTDSGQKNSYLVSINLKGFSMLDMIMVRDRSNRPLSVSHSGPVCADKLNDYLNQSKRVIYLGANYRREGHVLCYRDEPNRKLKLIWDITVPNGNIRSTVAVDEEGWPWVTTNEGFTYKVHPNRRQMKAYQIATYGPRSDTYLQGRIPTLCYGWGVILTGDIRNTLVAWAKFPEEWTLGQYATKYDTGWLRWLPAVNKKTTSIGPYCSLWRLTEKIMNLTALALSPGNEYSIIGTKDNRVVLFDRYTNKFTQRFDLYPLPSIKHSAGKGVVARPIWASHYTHTREGNVYVVSTNGYLYRLHTKAYSASPATPTWQLKLGNGAPLISSPALCKNGDVIVASTDGYLYRIGR